jgi:MFS family permease
MPIIQKIYKFLSLPEKHPIHPQVRMHFRRNFITNTMDGSFWMLGESFVSFNTILPVFASTLTESAILIGLVPAMIHAGWLIPQLLFAGHVKRLPVKLPFAKAMAVLERIPYLVLPFAAFSVRWISGDAALLLFMVVVAWRGLAGGMVALPWQELIATVIPSTVRSRFFGVSRTLGRIMGMIGAIIAGFILAEFSYPDNYALSFVVGAVFIWISYYFFSRTIEPKQEIVEPYKTKKVTHHPLIDFAAFKIILGRDQNFRRYLYSRSMFQLGSMVTGFLAVYGIQRFSLADEQAAIFTGLLFASGVMGFSVWGVFGDRIGPRKILLVSDLLHAVMLVLIFFSPSVWSIYLVFLVFGFCQSGHIIGELILGMELGSEEDRPIYLGLSRSIPGMFVLIAPLIGGSLVNWVGYQPMFIVATAFTILGIMFMLSVRERDNQSMQQPNL